MLRPRARLAKRRGATSVEFAVISLVFFTLILALFELGRGLMGNYVIVNAAREGCRAGVIPSRTNDDIILSANDALARSKITGATVTVKVNGEETNASAAKSGDRITVTVAVPVASFTWLPFTRYLAGNLTGQYTLRRE